MRFLFFLIFNVPFVINAQLKLLNLDLKKPDTNLIFIAGNYFKLSDDKEFAFYKIYCKNSDVRILDGSYFIRPKNFSNDTISVFKNGQLLLSKIYLIKKNSPLKAQVSNTDDTIISIERLLSSPHLGLKYVDGIMKMDSHIQSYRCKFFREGLPNIEVNDISGTYFNSDILYFLKTLKSGNKILFYDIVVGCSSCRNKIISPITITIR